MKTLRLYFEVGENVKEAAERLSRFTGRPTQPSEDGQIIALDRGRVELVTPEAFARSFPELPIPSLPFMGACGIMVGSLEAAERVLRGGGIKLRRRDHDLVALFPPELGIGAWVFFE